MNMAKSAAKLIEENVFYSNGEKVEGITYLDISIDSHLMSFAAEESRITKKISLNRKVK